ncbi:hypothetical protein [Hyphomonas sp.]|uniref:hypothetical protein n=1 Tax=Hyphomonas sp. TaxID=87 RepID=UPI0030FD0D0F
MILRRMTDAFRKQDWFTVVVETLIVVLGVFLGLQVNNWNTARALDVTEREYLYQLKDEIAEATSFLEYQETYANTVVASGQRALSFLEQDEPCTEDCASLLADFFLASNVWGTGINMSIYDEMERLGLPRAPETHRATRQYYDYLIGWDLVNLAPPAYRETVRGYFSPDASRAMWQKCHHLMGGTREVLDKGCTDDLEKFDAALMLEHIRTAPGLAEQLRFWIGQNNFALKQYPEALPVTRAAEAAIDADLGIKP